MAHPASTPGVGEHITYSSLPTIASSRVALQHILLNDAIKYNDKEQCEIQIEF